MIEKYPEFRPPSFPHQQAPIHKNLYAEFCVLRTKMLETIKKELGPSAEKKFYESIQPAPHCGWPGAQWEYDTSPFGLIQKSVWILRMLFDEIQKEDDERKAKIEEFNAKVEKMKQEIRKQREMLYETYIPILKRALVSKRYDIPRSETLPNNQRYIRVGNQYLHFYFQKRILNEVFSKVGEYIVSISNSAMDESMGEIQEICKKEYERQEDEYVGHRVAERLKTDERNVKVMTDEKYVNQFQEEIRAIASLEKL